MPRKKFKPLTSGRYTVIDVMREMGITQPHKSVTWPVGDKIRRLYEAETGRLPDKELRTKTSGKGSHMIAVYPARWEPRIRAAVKALTGVTSRVKVDA